MSNLNTVNPNERDSAINFIEKTHVYCVNGEYGYTSVTTVIGTQFKPFNADKVIRAMMNSSKWNPTNIYWGLTIEEIKNKWKKNGEESSMLGTEMHYYIELFLNNQRCDDTSVEFQYFLQFFRENPIRPYRTEWRIYNEDYKIAGSIDMIASNDDGTYSLYDWKRVKEIKIDTDYKTYSINPKISHVLDTNYWHYCLQLNLYKFILETKYNKQISHMFLVQLHPSLSTYNKIECPSMQDEIINLLN